MNPFPLLLYELQNASRFFPSLISDLCRQFELNYIVFKAFLCSTVVVIVSQVALS